MLQDPLTLYKLIVLYLLNRVKFPLTAAQISDFILEKEYTNFLTLQQVINELTEAGMVDAHTTHNRTHLSITEEGKSTLQFFENRISDPIKEDISNYLKEHEFTLQEELSIFSNYYKSTQGGYEAQLIAKERGTNLIDIKLSVPDKDLADAICNNWQKHNQEVYQAIIKYLF